MIKIAIINASTVLTDAQVKAAVPSLQKQIDMDFGPAWGVAATLRFVPHGQAPLPGEWWLAILDNSDQAGALGYHDLTTAGLPLSKVFAGTDKQYGLSWTVTASHELLEMLVDPNINLTVFEQGPLGARLYAYEVCDAVESDAYAYPIDGVLVSDFVLPSWFESFRQAGSTAFDFRNRLTAPFELLPGGYIGVNDLARGIGWYQIEHGQASALSKAPLGSRRQRRSVAPEQRLPSTAMPGSGGEDRPADEPIVVAETVEIEAEIVT